MSNQVQILISSGPFPPFIFIFFIMLAAYYRLKGLALPKI